MCEISIGILWFISNVAFCDVFQGLIDAHEQFKQTLGEADKEYRSVMALVEEVQRISQQYGIQGGADNPYTTLSAQVGHCRSHG